MTVVGRSAAGGGHHGDAGQGSGGEQAGQPPDGAEGRAHAKFSILHRVGSEGLREPLWERSHNGRPAPYGNRCPPHQTIAGSASAPPETTGAAPRRRPAVAARIGSSASVTARTRRATRLLRGACYGGSPVSGLP
ncbi:hypothetical protein GCM10018772_62260 [Streptomyces fumanus]|uniref:Uncharacterized protein n=1 Tax=Streptomyces fumanus TaxID=67302 RepID=A0A919AWG4_9ACTN|nr:hypothetical protein GCM10018772_62260 [Streptomyces fumanus]